MGMVKEFREFAVKGSVVDLAVGVIIGGALGKIVSSLVEDMVMPLVGTLLGGINFSGLALQVGAATPAPPRQETLLEEIRDLLKAR